MAKNGKPKRDRDEARPPRIKLSAEESLKRMQDIDQRKEAMIATVRKNKDRGLST